ncbi:MAG TPA: acyl-CoA dehydrogenase family protein [Nocardioidaceae bacterium]|nr:acyl-CoA dehydrogenase family protein [Nocardioidaceae bacterium]
MHFALSQEQEELATAVRSALATSSDAWKVLVEQIGAPALAVPEEYDGAGASLFETALVLNELGASLTPTPLLQTAVATRALLSVSHAEHLVAIAAGRSATVALDDVVLDGDLVLVVRDGVLHEATDVRRTPLPSMDQTLELTRLEILSSEPLGSVDEQQLRDTGAALVTALQVGAMQRSLDLTVAYVKERHQFGRPIGSFQALKHRLADCFVALETSRSVSWAACWAAANLNDDLSAKASTAKAWCGDALDLVASEMVQLHGGIAITWEHPAHLYFKRAHALGKLFGQSHEHRMTLAGNDGPS